MTPTIPPVADDEVMRIASIIERVEAASGPGRELDQAIYCAVTAAQGHRINKLVGGELEVWPKRDDRFFTVQPGMVLPYTASLDAAMTLVPEGWGWTVGDKSPEPSLAWCEIDHLPWRKGYAWAVERKLIVQAATPALALCAAALRVRSALQSEASDGQ